MEEKSLFLLKLHKRSGYEQLTHASGLSTPALYSSEGICYPLMLGIKTVYLQGNNVIEYRIYD